MPEESHDSTARQWAIEAKGIAAEAIGAVRSLENAVEREMAEVRRSFANGMVVVNENDKKNSDQTSSSETRMKADMTAMEGRLNTKISESEVRTISAINDIKSVVSAGSSKFWDLGAKILFALVAAGFAIVMLYVKSHP